MFLKFPHVIGFPASPGQAPNLDARRNYIRGFCAGAGLDLGGQEVDTLAAQAEAVPLIDREALLQNGPRAAGRLLTRNEPNVIRSVAEDWYMPSDETVATCIVGILASDYMGCPPGTVAVIRETDKATVAYLLLRLSVDVATLEFHFDGKQTARPAPLAPARSSAPRLLGGPDAASLTMRTLATLSFAIPPPLGVATSAFFSLIDMLLGSEEKRDNPFEELSKYLIEFKKQDRMTDILTSAIALSSKFNDYMSDWNPKKGGKEPSDHTIKTALSEVEHEVNAHAGSIYTDLKTLLGERYIDEENAFEILMHCITTYLFALRFILMCRAKLVERAHPKPSDPHDPHAVYDQGGALEGDDGYFELSSTWRDNYVTYKHAILGDGTPERLGWCETVKQLVARYRELRLAKVGPVFRVDNYITRPNAATAGITEIRMEGWAFLDEMWETHTESPVFRVKVSRWYEDTTEGCCSSKHTIDHRPQADHDHAVHLQNVKDELDKKYASAEPSIKAWAASISDYSRYLPPDAPRKLITIDPHGWKQAQAAPDSPWARYDTVMYCHDAWNSNTGGASPRSEWSEPVAIKGRGNPTITIPVVQSVMDVVKRRVFRKFSGHGTESRVLNVKIINDNTTTSWVDDYV